MLGNTLDHRQYGTNIGGFLLLGLNGSGGTLHFLCQLADGVYGGSHHLGSLTRLHFGLARRISGILHIARHLMHRCAHLG